MINDPQIQARNMLVKALDPVAGSIHMAGNPVKISAYDDPALRDPAPDLDESRPAILAELGA